MEPDYPDYGSDETSYYPTQFVVGEPIQYVDSTGYTGSRAYERLELLRMTYGLNGDATLAVSEAAIMEKYLYG